MERISLVLIARDEERFLPDCLASVRGRVDEIVVVDTGSRDRTRAIASSAGARVVDFAWVDDFSAARNAGLDAAIGTHVLVLDADERLACGPEVLRDAARDRKTCIGLMPLHDASALDARAEDVIAGRARLWAPCWVPRFFVRDPAIRFGRRVHETIFADAARVGARLSELGGGLRAVDAPIVHLGEVPALRAERGKRARNTRLIEMALAEDPRDGDLAGYLATELFRAGDAAGARAVGERHLSPFLAALDALPKSALRTSPVQLAAVFATCLLQDGDAARALEIVRASAARCLEPHPNLCFLEGAALERLGRASEAERAYEACLALHGKAYTIPVHPGATDSAPRSRLAALRLAAGDARGALAHLDAHGPFAGAFEVPALLARAEAHLIAGDAARALTAVQSLFARPKPPPDLFALAARAAELLGAPDAALSAAAERAPDKSWLEPRRRAWIAGAPRG